MERKREVGEKEKGDNEERKGGGGRGEETEWRERAGVHTMMIDI